MADLPPVVRRRSGYDRRNLPRDATLAALVFWQALCLFSTKGTPIERIRAACSGCMETAPAPEPEPTSFASQ